MSESKTMVTEEIGVASGKIWCFLNENGPTSLNRLCKETPLSRDIILQALGWLAREDKLQFEDMPRGRKISLK